MLPTWLIAGALLLTQPVPACEDAAAAIAAAQPPRPGEPTPEPGEPIDPPVLEEPVPDPGDPEIPPTPDPTAPCCYTNPRYAGVCVVRPVADETCGTILAYLNDVNSVGKTYCNTTDVRGGWEWILCDPGR
jgi:hypothetical protein